MEWQPIETAPKDGTDIIVTKFKNSFQRWEMRLVYWTTDYGPAYHWIQESNSGADDLFIADYFTHWMPLPAPPMSETAKEE